MKRPPPKPTWRYRELSYPMWMMAWWFRNAEQPPPPVRPWALIIALTVAAWLTLALTMWMILT